MTSILIVSEDKQKREAYATKLCVERGIEEVDRTLVKKPTADKKESKKLSQSIGIEQIKNMQGKVFLKPFKSPMKAVIIVDAHSLTPEAQNALLKVLEEPPAQTILILTSESRDALLPTILSRCSLIELGVQKLLSEQEQVEYGQVLQLLLHMTIPDGLKLAESLGKNKEDALLWLEKMILLSRQKMLDDYSYMPYVQSFQKTHTLLKTTNVSPRLALEQLLLSFTT